MRYTTDVVALREKFRPEIDPSLPTSAAHLRLISRDGREWEQTISAATGTPGNPMSDDDLREKFLDLTTEHLGAMADQLFDRALSVGSLVDPAS